ncbi:hypothetical protein M422DRAFT_252697, partial [Sphaerobolus stellatus SS14]
MTGPAAPHLWWDDAWAVFTVLLIDIFMAAIEFISRIQVFPFLDVEFVSPNSSLKPNIPGRSRSHPTTCVHNSSVPLHGSCLSSYYPPQSKLIPEDIRSARISILFTVIRLSVGTLRKILSYAFIVFLTIWAVLFAQVWWVCEREPGWKDAPLPQCDLGLNVAVVQVITDVLCDAFLIFVPLRLVWNIRLTRPQKIRITAIFSTTIVTTCVSMSHAFFVLHAGELKKALAAIVQDAVSLIVANLSVLIAYLFRTGTEEPESAPTFGTRSIITFGGSGKKRNPAITTTYITTETMDHEDPAVITQKTLGSTVDGGEE